MGNQTRGRHPRTSLLWDGILCGREGQNLHFYVRCRCVFSGTGNGRNTTTATVSPRAACHCEGGSCEISLNLRGTTACVSLCDRANRGCDSMLANSVSDWHPQSGGGTNPQNGGTLRRDWWCGHEEAVHVHSSARGSWHAGLDSRIQGNKIDIRVTYSSCRRLQSSKYPHRLPIHLRHHHLRHHLHLER